MMPILLDLRDREVCIFGGGRVALRKARLFSQHARVRVISREFLPEFQDLDVYLTRTEVEDPEPHIGQAFIVIPATNDRELNERIAAAARRRGCLVDSVDCVGDIIVPSMIQRGDLVIAVSTSGRSPAVARFLREQLEELVKPSWEGMVRLHARLRILLKERVPDQEEREAILRRCVEDQGIWRALEQGKDQEAWERMLRIAGI